VKKLAYVGLWFALLGGAGYLIPRGACATGAEPTSVPKEKLVEWENLLLKFRIARSATEAAQRDEKPYVDAILEFQKQFKFDVQKGDSVDLKTGAIIRATPPPTPPKVAQPDAGVK
jgi:hypothetical protein